jgi:2,5-dioxopentanoate dehydrogenase
MLQKEETHSRKNAKQISKENNKYEKNIMSLTGRQLINGEWILPATESGYFQAINPADNSYLPTKFSNASDAEVEAATQEASRSFVEYSAMSAQTKAGFLETIAVELEELKSEIVAQGMLETGLPEARLQGELGRTTGQLRMFAALLKKGEWKRAVIDTADPERQPVPKPDIRLTQIPLGPVVVFAASNFPLAFSTAGGDTASALAAGCPVIVKPHSSHPGTSELVATGILAAIEKCQMPKGVFALLHGPGRTLGSTLVKHPAIKAGGFTGSVAGGRALFDLANSRPDPIPFYGELGSTNPVFLLPQALKSNAEKIAEAFVNAMTMGAGQFCTSPGIAILCKGDDADKFLTKMSALISEQTAQTMLNPGICSSYKIANVERASISELKVVGESDSVADEENRAQVHLFSVSANDYLAQTELEEEVFGPSTLAIICENTEQMLQVAESFYGHLTCAIHEDSGDESMAGELAQLMQNKVGRLLFNGFGTGVEVCAGMSHGGPYPSSTNVQTTSVGERAIDRFVRPICFQNTPDALLPDELKNANPLEITRLVDGNWSSAAL